MAEAIAYAATKVAGWIGAAVLNAGGSSSLMMAASTAAYWATSVGLTVGATAAINSLARTETPSIEAVMTPFRQTRPSKRLSTGTLRLAGKAMLWDNVPDWNIDVWAINEGRISQFRDWYIHGEKVSVNPSTGLVAEQATTRKYWGEHVYIFGRPGRTTEVPTSKLVGVAGSKWTNAHRGDGVAAFDVMSRAAGDKYSPRVYQDAEIVVTVVADTSLVFDWRDPTQSLTNPSTWKFSDNAVVTHLWWEWYGRYLKNAREDNVTPNARQLLIWNRLFAPALEYWTTAANIADENMPKKGGGTRKKYRAAVTYEFGTDPAETRRKYLNAYDGKMFRLKNGSWAVRAGKYVEPTLTFTDPDILEVVEWSQGRTATEFTNVLTSTFLSPQNDYTEQPVDPWEDLASIEQVGAVDKAFPLPAVPEHGQARYLLKREMSRRRASHTGVLMLKKDAGQKIGDGAHRWIRVQMSNGPLSLADAVLEVSGPPVIDHVNLTCIVPVIMFDANVDLWDAALEEGFGPNETTRTGPAAVATPVISSIAVELQGVSGALLAVRIPTPNNHLFEYAVSWRKVGATDWHDGDFKDYADATIGGVNYAVVRSDMVQAGADYQVRVRARKSMFLSDWSIATTVDFDTVPAPSPGDWSLTTVAGQNGLTGVYLQVTGACNLPFVSEILVAYRVAGVGGFISWGPYPPDTTVIPIGPVIESSYYEAAIAYRAKWGAIGDALVIFNSSSSLEPKTYEVEDGGHVTFDPPLSGIPTYSIDMSDCLPPDTGEAQIYRVTNLTPEGADFAFKNSDESETSAHHTAPDVGNMGGYFQCLKPTVADAYNGLYKFTVPVERAKPHVSAPWFAWARIEVRASGSDEWKAIGAVGGTILGPTKDGEGQSAGMTYHVVTIDCAIALGSDGVPQFRAYHSSNIGQPHGLTVEYDTEVTAATEVTATDATHKAKVTIYPPGYNGTVTEGIFFDGPAAAAKPVLAAGSIPAAEIIGFHGGQIVKFPVTQLPFSSGSGSDPYALSNIESRGNDEAGFNTALTNAKANGTPLTGNKGTIAISVRKDMTGCHIHMPFKTITFGGNIGSSSGMTGQVYTGIPDVVGPVIELGGSALSPKHYEKLLRIDGAYPGDGTVQDTPCTAVRIKDDQGARSSYDIGLQNHRGDGLEINSDTEKKFINYRFQNLYQGNVLAFRALNNLSPDEVVVKMAGGFCSNLIYAQDGGQFSYRVEFAVENIRPWIGSYAIEDNSRKSTCYAGEIRFVDGDLMKVETRQSGNSGGGPNVVFDNLRVIQHYCGRITLANSKSVGGTLYHDQVDNTREAVKTTAYRNSLTSGQDMHFTRAAYQPAFQIGAVLENCTLTYVTRRNVCPVGARIGISDWVNPDLPNGSAFSGKTIRLEIEMGDRNGPAEVVGSFSGTTLSIPKPSGGERPLLTVGQFLRAPGLPYWLRVVVAPNQAALNALPDGTPATYTVNQAVTTGLITIDATAPANMFDAFWADYGPGSTIWATGNLKGNIRITGGWQQGVIHVSAAWVRAGYTVNFDTITAGAPTTEFIIHGAMEFAEIAAIPWAFKGCKVLTVNDFDGASLYYNGTKWVPSSPPRVPELALSAMGSPMNSAAIKRAGLSVVRADTGLPWYATGDAASSPWSSFSTSITPTWDAATNNFESRAGPFSTAYKLAFDRFIYDARLAGVFTGNWSTSKLKGLWPLIGPSAAAAKNNLLFDFWDLNPVYYDDHQPGVGFLPYQGSGYPSMEVLRWDEDDHRYGTSPHNLMMLASCGVLLNSAQSSTGQGGPYFTGGGWMTDFRLCFHRLDGGNHAQINAQASSRVIAPSLSDTGMPYRIGMAWTPNSTSQSIRMYGGQAVTEPKMATVSGGESQRIFFGHAYEYYLRVPIEIAGLGSGDFTPEEAEATLKAVNTLRTTLKALG